MVLLLHTLQPHLNQPLHPTSAILSHLTFLWNNMFSLSSVILHISYHFGKLPFQRQFPLPPTQTSIVPCLILHLCPVHLTSLSRFFQNRDGCTSIGPPQVFGLTFPIIPNTMWYNKTLTSIATNYLGFICPRDYTVLWILWHLNMIAWLLI